MKFYCVIFATLLAVLSVSAESNESRDLDAFIAEQIKICQKETNASDKDVDDMVDRVEPTTKTAKCLISCLVKKTGVMSEANKLQPENLSKLVMDDKTKAKDGKSVESIIKTVGDICKAVTDPDPCEAGVKIIACLNAEAVKLGFEKGPF